MADPFLAEIIMFGGNFAPRGWAYCDGQILPINTYQSLYSLLGTTYGGDGRTSFGLPDLRSRIPIGTGNGPGLSNRNLGQKGGAETTSENPAHTHPFAVRAHEGDADQTDPAGHRLATPAGDGAVAIYSDQATGLANMADETTASAGTPSVSNIQPFNTVHYIIALQGTFPSRN